MKRPLIENPLPAPQRRSNHEGNAHAARERPLRDDRSSSQTRHHADRRRDGGPRRPPRQAVELVSERLFAEYLTAHGRPFERDYVVSSLKRNVDFFIDRAVFCDVKECASLVPQEAPVGGDANRLPRGGRCHGRTGRGRGDPQEFRGSWGIPPRPCAPTVRLAPIWWTPEGLAGSLVGTRRFAQHTPPHCRPSTNGGGRRASYTRATARICWSRIELPTPQGRDCASQSSHAR